MTGIFILFHYLPGCLHNPCNRRYYVRILDKKVPKYPTQLVLSKHLDHKQYIHSIYSPSYPSRVICYLICLRMAETHCNLTFVCLTGGKLGKRRHQVGYWRQGATLHAGTPRWPWGGGTRWHSARTVDTWRTDGSVCAHPHCAVPAVAEAAARGAHHWEWTAAERWVECN